MFGPTVTMKKNPIFLLALGICLLTIIAYASGVFETHVTTLELPEFHVDAAAVRTIAVLTPAIHLRLSESNGAWRLDEPMTAPADSNVVSRFVHSMSSLTPESIVSTNIDRYSEYGVDSTAQKIILGKSSGDSIQVVLGRQGPDYQSVYVRIAKDPRVIMAKGPVILPKDTDAWRDKVMMNAGAPSVIQSAEVSNGDEQYIVRSDHGQWKLDTKGATLNADSAAVSRWLGRFNPLRADGFIPDLALDAVRKGATGHIKMETIDGKPVELWLQKRSKDIAAVSSTGGDVYKLYSYHQSNLLPDSGSLKAKKKK